MNLEHALTVEGFMSSAELVYIAQVAQKSRLVVEIGSWLGRSACAFAANVGEHTSVHCLPWPLQPQPNRGIVFCVDTWQNRLEHDFRVGIDEEFWYKFVYNTLPYKNIIPVRKESTEAARLFAELGVCFDAVFIDATHSYEACKADILAWRSLVRSGGILFGHDLGHLDWPGVKQAVDELIPKYSVVDSIWTTEEL